MALERRHQLRSLTLEARALRRGHRIAAPIAQCASWIALHAIDEHLEMKVRSRRQTSHADVGHGLADGHARSGVDARREAAQVAIA